MHKRGQTKRAGRGGSGGKLPNPLKSSDNIIRVPFHKLAQVVLAAGVASGAFAPDNIGSRTTQLADAYGKYRYVELQYRLLPGGTAPGNSCVTMCYYPGILDTFPTNATQNAENPHCHILSNRQTVPSPWTKLAKEATMSYFNWYKTKAGSLDPSEENVGYFVWADYGTSTATLLYEVAGVIEFAAPVEISSTPAEHRAKLIAKERERLARLGVKLNPQPNEVSCTSLGKFTKLPE